MADTPETGKLVGGRSAPFRFPRRPAPGELDIWGIPDEDATDVYCRISPRKSYAQILEQFMKEQADGNSQV